MRRSFLLPMLLFIALVAAVATVVCVYMVDKHPGLLSGEKPSAFSEGWKNATGESVSIPGTVTATADGQLKIRNVLPSKMPNGGVLYLKTSDEFLSVFVSGLQVYSWDVQNKAPFLQPFGLSSYMIRLPASAAGKTIELRFDTHPQNTAITVYGITLGDGITSFISLISDNSLSVVFFFLLSAIFVFVLGIAIIFSRRLRGQNYPDIIYLGIFIALSSLWVITDSDLSMMLSPNIAVSLYCSVCSLMLLPAPLLLLMRRFAPHGKFALNFMAILVLLNFLLCLVLLFLGIADLLQTLFISHILEMLACTSILLLVILELFKHKKKYITELFVGLLIFCVLGITSNILFALNKTLQSSLYAQIGLTLFILTIGLSIARYGINELVKSKSYVRLTMSIPSGICRIENFDTGRIIFANEFYYKLFGYNEAEALAIGFTTADFTVLPEDLTAMKEKIKKNYAHNKARFETEARHVKKNGEIIWVLARYSMEEGSFGATTLVMIDITDRKQTEEKLRISEEEYRIATLHSNKLIIRLDIRTKTSYSQSNLPSVFDMPAILENVPDSIIATGIIAQDSIDVFRAFFDAIYNGDRDGNAVVSIYDRAAGEYRWYHYDFTSIYDNSNKPVQAIISYYDVTLQRQKEMAFQRWQQSYNSIPKNATNYYEYNLTDDLFEHEEGGMLPEIPDIILRKLFSVTSYIAEKYVYIEDIDNWLAFLSRDRLLESYASGQHADKMEFRRITDSEPKWTSLSIQLIPDPYSSDVKGYFLLEDIDAQKKTEINLQERSTLDSLTGLLNRATFIEKFNGILHESDLETQHALIMLDIDNFKTINDTLGHTAGDALLISIASKLKYALRTDDLCGRLGGDEFVICLKSMNLGKPLETRVSDLCSLICDERNSGIPISASFGIASFPYNGTTFEELYKKADIALYRAKAQGRGCYAVYDPQLSFDDMTTPQKIL